MILVASAENLSTRCSAAGIRPARAGNFSLTRQRKVTKRGALMQSALERDEALAMLGIGPCLHATRCALAAVPMTSTIHRPFTPLNAGCTPGSSGNTKQPRRPSDAAFGFAREHGVQPRVGRAAGAIGAARDKSCARAERFASSRNASGCFRAPLFAASRSCAVQGLFFGDFLLAPQKKVTRPPGRTPGNAASNRTPHRAS